MRVAVVQLTTTQDKAANLVALSRAVAEEADAGAGLVVFPEATMCTFGSPSVDLAPIAEPLDGPFVDALRDLAARRGVTVVAGMFERSPQARRPFNTVVAVGPVGLLGAYRKLHLYDAAGWQESARFQAADPVRDPLLVFPADGLVVGVLTCYDLRFPEVARALVDRGATALAVCAHWLTGPGKADAWSVLLRARAIESVAYVAGAAKPAPECVGLSAVVDPMGVVRASLGSDDEGAVAADLDPSRVAAVRAEFPLLKQHRFTVSPSLSPQGPSATS